MLLNGKFLTLQTEEILIELKKITKNWSDGSGFPMPGMPKPFSIYRKIRSSRSPNPKHIKIRSVLGGMTVLLISFARHNIIVQILVTQTDII